MELHDPLKPREIEILRLMAEGLTNREIGEQLYIGFETVKWYAKQIYSKLDVSSRQDASDKAQELGLLDDEQPKQPGYLVKSNLPKQSTAFVGREAEINTVIQLIEQDRNHLVTVLATGGMGKTRLAIEVASRVVDKQHFDDGVFFIPLQPLSDSDSIIHAIASHTGYQFQKDTRTPKQQVLDFLSGKQALLVMDNWEHLLADAPLVNEIVKVASDVTILATSREKLNLSGEILYTLQGMTFPTWETPEDALEYDAVKLLLQSAKRVKPNWEVTQGNLDYVARVCRVTAGMPLAIILATSWLDMLSLEEIASEIEKNVDFLETEMRDVPDRQRSIRAVFDYTWKRLEPAERDIFMKLSVFRGGFTRQAVEAVTGASLRNLHRLSEKVLINRNPDGRFDVHELLRQYGEAELEQSAVADDVYAAHSTVYLNYLAGLEAQIKGHGQQDALDDVEIEFDNIHRAWDYALKSRMFHLIDKSAEALFWAMERRDHIPEGVVLLQAAQQALSQDDNQQLLWARVTLYCHYLFGQPLNLDDFDHAKAIAEQYQDRRSIAFAYLASGWFLYVDGNPKKATEASQHAYDIYESLDDKFHMAFILNRLGFYQWRSPELFQTYVNRSVVIQREIGDEKGLSWGLGNLGAVYVVHLQYEQAQSVLDGAIAVEARIHKRTVTTVSALVISAWMYAQRGEFEKLKAVVTDADEIVQMLHGENIQGQADTTVAWLAITERDFETAERRSRRAIDFLMRTNPNWGQLIYTQLVFILVVQGHISEVEDYLIRIATLTSVLVPSICKLYCAVKSLYWSAIGQPVRATVMLAFTFSDTLDAFHWFKDMPLFQTTYQKLQSELDEDRFTSAWQHGETMTYEEANTYALSDR